MKYFWYIDGKSKGPYTPGEAAEILGGISPDTLVCHESDNPDSPGSWHKFSKLPEIVNSWDPEDFKSRETQSAPAAKRQARILATDDDSFIRSLLWEILSADGHELEFAADGKDAYSKILSRGYDLVILDVNMPEINGYKLSRMISQKLGHRRPKIIIYTARDIEKEKYQFLVSEADEIISKTTPVPEIEKKVRALLDLKLKSITSSLAEAYKGKIDEKITETDGKTIFSALSNATLSQI